MTLLERINERLNAMEEEHSANALIGWSEDLNMLQAAAARIRELEQWEPLGRSYAAVGGDQYIHDCYEMKVRLEQLLTVAREALSNISFDIRHGRFNEALAVVGPALRQFSQIAEEQS